VERWMPMRPSPSVTLAVLAQGEPEVREITDALTRDGLVVTLAFAGFTDMGLDMLSPQPDVIVVDASANAFDAEGAIRRTRGALPGAAIVVICPQGAERAVRRYLQAGPMGSSSRTSSRRTCPLRFVARARDRSLSPAPRATWCHRPLSATARRKFSSLPLED